MPSLSPLCLPQPRARYGSARAAPIPRSTARGCGRQARMGESRGGRERREDVSLSLPSLLLFSARRPQLHPMRRRAPRSRVAAGTLVRAQRRGTAFGPQILRDRGVVKGLRLFFLPPSPKEGERRASPAAPPPSPPLPGHLMPFLLRCSYDPIVETDPPPPFPAFLPTGPRSPHPPPPQPKKTNRSRRSALPSLPSLPRPSSRPPPWLRSPTLMELRPYSVRRTRRRRSA